MKSAFDQYVSAAVRKERMAPGCLAGDTGIWDRGKRRIHQSGREPQTPGQIQLNHLNEIARFLGCSPRDFLPEKPL